MSSATIILWAIALVLLGFSLREGPDTARRGVEQAW